MGRYGLLTVNSNGRLRANNGANSTTGAALSFKRGRVIPFGSDVVVGKCQHFLRAGCHTHLTTLAIPFIDLDTSLNGHSSYLLIRSVRSEQPYYPHNRAKREVLLHFPYSFIHAFN
jgi:hypothetical protein